MGLSKFAPPSTSVPGVHSQCLRCSEELPPCIVPKDSAWRRGAIFGPGLPRPGLVPPLPFLPASTVCSTWHFAGLLHPAADPGVRHVSGLSSRGAVPDFSSRRSGGAVPVSGRSPVAPEGTAVSRPSADHAALCARPRGIVLAFAARLAFVSLGPFPMALHPSELSPRQQLCRVNRAFQPHSRPSALPRADPVGVWCLERDRPYGAGHRGHCLLVVVPGFLSPRVRPTHAQAVHGWDSAVRSTSRRSSADESVAFAACFHSTDARCSLGLRPSKACSHDKGVIGRSTGTGVGAPFPCAASESRLVRDAVVSWVVGACVGRSPTLLASQRGLRVRASLTELLSWLASCPAGCPAGVRMPPTRPAPAPEGVSTRRPTPGTTSSGLSVSWSRGDPVSLSPMSPSAPEGSFGSTIRVRGLSWPSGTSARGHSSPVHRRLLLLRQPHPAWAGGRRRQARRRVRPRR
jgi:hypothetical protein